MRRRDVRGRFVPSVGKPSVVPEMTDEEAVAILLAPVQGEPQLFSAWWVDGSKVGSSTNTWQYSGYTPATEVVVTSRYGTVEITDPS